VSFLHKFTPIRKKPMSRVRYRKLLFGLILLGQSLVLLAKDNKVDGPHMGVADSLLFDQLVLKFQVPSGYIKKKAQHIRNALRYTDANGASILISIRPQRTFYTKDERSSWLNSSSWYEEYEKSIMKSDSEAKWLSHAYIEVAGYSGLIYSWIGNANTVLGNVKFIYCLLQIFVDDQIIEVVIGEKWPVIDGAQLEILIPFLNTFAIHETI